MWRWWFFLLFGYDFDQHSRLLLWQWIFDHRGSDNAAYSTTDVVAYGDAYKTDLLAYSVAHKTDSTAYGVAYYSAYNHALVYHVCLLVRNK